MIIGNGALLYALGFGVVVVISAIKQQKFASWLMYSGLAICFYWFCTMKFGLWIPSFLGPLWYPLILLGFLLMVGGAVGVIIKIIRELASQ